MVSLVALIPVSSEERTLVTPVPSAAIVSLVVAFLVSWEDLVTDSLEDSTLVLAALVMVSLAHLILALSAALSPVLADITPDFSVVRFLASEELILASSADSTPVLVEHTPASEEFSPDLVELTLAS